MVFGWLKRLFSRKKKPVEEKETQSGQLEEEKRIVFETLPVRVDGFSELLEDAGFERGSTILIAGGAGTGKTTFCMETVYNAALNGEKSVYITFEELPEKISFHMKKNFGWDLDKMVKAKKIAFLKLDALDIVRRVEATLEQKYGDLRVEVGQIKMPFEPDWIIVDSLSVLSIAFKQDETYRMYLAELFSFLNKLGSVNLVISETEQSPQTFSRSGIEEFLSDGVIVLYNLKEKKERENALEILKMRSGKHVKKIVPYILDKNGFIVLAKDKSAQKST